MSDELHRKLFRRVRRHKGETWKPGRRNQPNQELGLWCFRCRTVHPWRNSRTLGTQYEQRSDKGFRILWICARTGEVLIMQDLVRSNNQPKE